MQKIDVTAQRSAERETQLCLESDFGASGAVLAPSVLQCPESERDVSRFAGHYLERAAVS